VGGWSTVLVAAVLIGGCGASAATASNASRVGAAGYATSPASAGRIDPRALPLGDGYVSTNPMVGYVDSCTTTFGAGGAESSVPWIDAKGKTWNALAKLTVRGSVSWPSAYYRTADAHGRRLLTFDDLPIDHPTGTFPIATSDPAYRYDHNPNHIAAQSFSWSLPLHPQAAARPTCTGLGPIGVLDDGVLLFNALDAGGRDAAAHELQDACGGHPNGMDEYHHHDVPACILEKTPNGRSTLVGYALDGYGIYVEKNRHGGLPTNRELDGCHGTTSTVGWNGKPTRIYHYVATLEYPYTVGCFHGTPITISHSPPPAGPGSGPPGGSGAGGAPGPPSGT
jgi:hypothetical protein